MYVAQAVDDSLASLSPPVVEPLLSPVAVVPLLPPPVAPLLPLPVANAITEDYIFLHTKLSTPAGHIYATPEPIHFAGISPDLVFITNTM